MEGEGKAREEKVEKRSSIGEQTGDIIVEEVDGGTTSTDLSGWQVGRMKHLVWSLRINVYGSYIIHTCGIKLWGSGKTGKFMSNS